MENGSFCSGCCADGNLLENIEYDNGNSMALYELINSAIAPNERGMKHEDVRGSKKDI